MKDTIISLLVFEEKYCIILQIMHLPTAGYAVEAQRTLVELSGEKQNEYLWLNKAEMRSSKGMPNKMTYFRVLKKYIQGKGRRHEKSHLIYYFISMRQSPSGKLIHIEEIQGHCKLSIMHRLPMVTQFDCLLCFPTYSKNIDLRQHNRK